MAKSRSNLVIALLLSRNGITPRAGHTVRVLADALRQFHSFSHSSLAKMSLPSVFLELLRSKLEKVAPATLKEGVEHPGSTVRSELQSGTRTPRTQNEFKELQRHYYKLKGQAESGAKRSGPRDHCKHVSEERSNPDRYERDRRRERDEPQRYRDSSRRSPLRGQAEWRRHDGPRAGDPAPPPVPGEAYYGSRNEDYRRRGIPLIDYSSSSREAYARRYDERDDRRYERDDFRRYRSPPRGYPSSSWDYDRSYGDEETRRLGRRREDYRSEGFGPGGEYRRSSAEDTYRRSDYHREDYRYEQWSAPEDRDRRHAHDDFGRRDRPRAAQRPSSPAHLKRTSAMPTPTMTGTSKVEALLVEPPKDTAGALHAEPPEAQVVQEESAGNSKKQPEPSNADLPKETRFDDVVEEVRSVQVPIDKAKALPTPVGTSPTKAIDVDKPQSKAGKDMLQEKADRLADEIQVELDKLRAKPVSDKSARMVATLLPAYIEATRAAGTNSCSRLSARPDGPSITYQDLLDLYRKSSFTSETVITYICGKRLPADPSVACLLQDRDLVMDYLLGIDCKDRILGDLALDAENFRIGGPTFHAEVNTVVFPCILAAVRQLHWLFVKASSKAGKRAIVLYDSKPFSREPEVYNHLEAELQYASTCLPVFMELLGKWHAPFAGAWTCGVVAGDYIVQNNNDCGLFTAESVMRCLKGEEPIRKAETEFADAIGMSLRESFLAEIYDDFMKFNPHLFETTTTVGDDSIAAAMPEEEHHFDVAADDSIGHDEIDTVMDEGNSDGAGDDDQTETYSWSQSEVAGAASKHAGFGDPDDLFLSTLMDEDEDVERDEWVLCLQHERFTTLTWAAMFHAVLVSVNYQLEARDVEFIRRKRARAIGSVSGFQSYSRMNQKWYTLHLPETSKADVLAEDRCKVCMKAKRRCDRVLPQCGTCVEEQIRCDLQDRSDLTRRGRFFLAPVEGLHRPSINARIAFGSHEWIWDVTDDIDESYALVIIMYRRSAIRNNKFRNLIDDSESRGHELFLLWSSIFQRDKDNVPYACCGVGVVSSNQVLLCREVFDGNGIASQLDELNREQPASNILLLQSFYDGSTTDNRSWSRLLEEWPNLEFRLTIVSDRSCDARFSKQRRLLYWSHYDIKQAASVYGDGDSWKNQLPYPDQVGGRARQIWKHQRFVNHIQHVSDIKSMMNNASNPRDERYAALTGRRNTYDLPKPAEKQCENCGCTTPPTYWIRGGDSSDAVRCDACGAREYLVSEQEQEQSQRSECSDEDGLEEQSCKTPAPMSGSEQTPEAKNGSAKAESGRDSVMKVTRRQKPRRLLTLEDRTCSICGKVLSAQSRMDVHMAVHSKSEKRQRTDPATLEHRTCTICGRVLSTRSYMPQHLRRHKRDRQLCQICGQNCGSIANYNAHMRTQHVDRRHHCEICGKHYANSDGLRHHVYFVHPETVGPEGPARRTRGLNKPSDGLTWLKPWSG